MRFTIRHNKTFHQFLRFAGRTGALFFIFLCGFSSTAVWGTATPTPEPSVTPTCLPLVADFEAPELICIGEPSLFRDACSGDIVAWFWIFSGGGMYFSQDVVHTFQETGNHEVYLQVQDVCGNYAEVTKYVNVVDCLPPLWNVGEGIQPGYDDDSSHRLDWSIYWTPLSDQRDEIRYTVERSIDDSEWISAPETTGLSGWHYTNEFGYEAGEMIRYRVRAESDTTISRWSYTDGILYSAEPSIGRIVLKDPETDSITYTNDDELRIYLENVSAGVSRIKISEHADFDGAEWLEYPPASGDYYVYELEEPNDGTRQIFVKPSDGQQKGLAVNSRIIRDTRPVEPLKVTLMDTDDFSPVQTDSPTVYVLLDLSTEEELIENPEKAPARIKYTENADCSGGSWALFERPLPPYDFTDDTYGEKVLYVMTEDRAGNLSECVPGRIQYLGGEASPEILTAEIADADTLNVDYTNDTTVLVHLETKGAVSEILIWEGDDPSGASWQGFTSWFTYTFASSQEGLKEVRIQIRGPEGRESEIITARTILDATSPKLMLAGYWNSSLSPVNDGLVSIFCYVDESYPANVEIIYDGEPTGSFLPQHPDIPQVFHLQDIPVGPMGAASRHLFELRASDLAGNISSVWPYLTVNYASTESSGSAASGLQKISEALSSFVKLEGWNIVSPFPDYGPQIMAAGWWNSGITEMNGGTLIPMAYVFDAMGASNVRDVELLYSHRTTGFKLMDDGGPNDFNPDDGIFAASTELPAGIPGGRYFFQLQAENKQNITSGLWPYLEVMHENTPPVAWIDSPADGAFYAAGSQIHFKGDAFDRETGDVPGSYFKWFWVKNSLGEQFAEGKEVWTDLPEEARGIVKIRLMVQDALDPDNVAGTAETEISLQGDPLNLALSATPDSGKFPLSVHFSANVSGGFPPFRYVWYFSDGDEIFESDSHEFRHTFDHPGVYDAYSLIKDKSSSIVYDQISIEVTQNEIPDLVIVSPENNAHFYDTDTIMLLGTAMDREDGALPDQNVHWESNLDGFLGDGWNCFPANLSPSDNAHQIVFKGHDSFNDEGLDSVELIVDPWTPVREHMIQFNGFKLFSWVLFEDLLPGEQLRWDWLINGRTAAIITLTVEQAVEDEIEITTGFPGNPQSGDLIEVRFHYKHTGAEQFRHEPEFVDHYSFD